MRCAVCGQVVVARQNVLFEANDRVVHVRCFLAASRAVTRRTPDRICPACTKPISPAESVIRRGADVLHTQCAVEPQRPIAGGAVLPAWPLIGDDHIGRRFGTSQAGHCEFMAACAETLLVSRRAVTHARRAVAQSRATRRA
jgi:hypothetical protein